MERGPAKTENQPFDRADGGLSAFAHINSGVPAIGIKRTSRCDGSMAVIGGIADITWSCRHETHFSRFALDAAYASIGLRKLRNDASTCPGTRQRHGAARQHGSQRLRQPRTSWSAGKNYSLGRQDKAARHCVMVGLIWARGQHEAAGMQGRGERGGA